MVALLRRVPRDDRLRADAHFRAAAARARAAQRRTQGRAACAKAAAAAKDRRMARSEASARFAIGDRVAHRIFGAGTVKAIDEEKRAYVIAFDDLDTMRSIAFQAKLEKA